EGEPATVDGDDHCVDGVVVGGTVLRARARAAPRALVALVVGLVVAVGHRTTTICRGAVFTRPFTPTVRARSRRSRGTSCWSWRCSPPGCLRPLQPESRRRAPSGGRRTCGRPRTAEAPDGSPGRRAARRPGPPGR